MCIRDSYLCEVTKKEVKKKKGQALHPAVGEAVFSTDDDDSQRWSWRQELEMRLSKGKPRFASSLGLQRNACLSSFSETPVPGCGNTAPPADHHEAPQEQDQRQMVYWGQPFCKAHHDIKAVMLASQGIPQPPRNNICILSFQRETGFWFMRGPD